MFNVRNKLYGIKYKSFFKIDKIKMAEIVNITDAIQGIFDYV